jgi:hypothetical protein
MRGPDEGDIPCGSDIGGGRGSTFGYGGTVKMALVALLSVVLVIVVLRLLRLI